MNLAFNLTPLWLTLKVAGLATLVAVLAGVALAFLLARRQFWGREWLDAFQPGRIPFGRGGLDQYQTGEAELEQADLYAIFSDHRRT